jgi:hypothetical protein
MEFQVLLVLYHCLISVRSTQCPLIILNLLVASGQLKGGLKFTKKKCVNLGSFMWELGKGLVGSNVMQSNLHV